MTRLDLWERWRDLLLGWRERHPIAVQWLNLARVIAMWASLLLTVILCITVEAVRGVVGVAVIQLVVLAWGYFLVRTKSVSWSFATTLYGAGIAAAVGIAWLSGMADFVLGISASSDGQSVGIAPFFEEALKLSPLIGLALVAPGRLRRFTLGDWGLSGFILGMSFATTEEMTRQMAGGVIFRAQGVEFHLNPLRSTEFSSILSSGVAPGHPAWSGVLALSIGVGIYLWRKGTAWRPAAVAVPWLICYWVVSEHARYNAQGKAGDVIGELINLPGVLTGEGKHSIFLANLALIAAMLVDTHQRTRAALRRTQPWYQPYSTLEPDKTATTWLGSLAGSRLASPAMFVIHSLSDWWVTLQALHKREGESFAAALGRGAQARTEVRRLRRYLPDLPSDQESAARAAFRTRSVGIGLAATIVLLIAGSAFAWWVGSSISDPAHGGFWGNDSLFGDCLGCIWDSVGQWWNNRSLGTKVVLGLVGAGLVLAAGGGGLALALTGGLFFGLDRYKGVETFARDPRAATMGYLGSASPGQMLGDAAALALSVLPIPLSRALPGYGAATSRVASREGSQSLESWLARSPGAARPRSAEILSLEPINVVSGEMCIEEVDLTIEAAPPFEFERWYRSGRLSVGSFGIGWRSILDVQAEIGAQLVVEWVDGRLLSFPIPEPQGQGQGSVAAADPAIVAAFVDGRLVVHDARTQIWVYLDPTAPVAAQSEAGVQHAFSFAGLTHRSGAWLQCERAYPGGPAQALVHSGGARIDIETRAGAAGTPLVQRLVVEGQEIAAFEYDNRDRLTHRVRPLNGDVRYQWDEADRITRWEDANGHWYGYVYDEQGRAIQGQGSEGFLAGSLRYDTGSRTTWVSDALGQVSTYQYDEQGYVVRAAHPSGAITETQWGPGGQPVVRTGADGATMRMEYDSRALLVAQVGADGIRSSLTRDAVGDLVSVEHRAPDGASRAWTFERNERGLVTREVDPAGGVTSYTYDSAGHVQSVQDPTGRTTQVQCNTAGLPVRTIDPVGATTVMERDALGRPTSVTAADGGVQRFTWSPAGKLISSTDPLGALTHFEYDAEGNQLRQILPTGAVSSRTYGPLDQVTSATDEVGGVVRLRRDPLMRLAQVSNQLGHTWSYQYDAAGRVSQEVAFDGRVIGYEYDAGGRVIGQISAGERIATSYDAAGRPTTQAASDAQVHYRYDSFGQLIAVENESGVLTLERDAAGRVIAEEFGGVRIASSLDESGRVVGVQGPAGLISFGLDETGRAAQVSVGSDQVRVGFDPLGRVASAQVAGVGVTRSFDLAGRLLGSSLVASGGALGGEDPAQALLERTWQYRSDGIPTAEHSRGPGLGLEALAGGDVESSARSFDADAAGRLLGVADSAGGTETYALDAGGRVLEAAWDATASADGGESVDGLSVGARAFEGVVIRRAGRVHVEHDAAGRLVRKSWSTLSGQARECRYRWNGFNQLVEAVNEQGEHWRYAYDGLGRRRSKQCLAGNGQGSVTHFVWSGALLREEHRQWVEGGVQRRWTRSWVYEADLTGEPGPGGGGGAPVVQVDRDHAVATARVGVVLADPVGRACLLADRGGVVWRDQTSTFGAGVSGRGGSTSSVGLCPLGSPGQYRDEELGWWYQGARYFDPALPRFVTPDPLGWVPNPGDDHGYLVNPLVWLDPFGLNGCSAAANTADRISGPLWTATKSKSAAGNALGHFNKHRADFPHLNNSLDYVAEAQGFLKNPGPGVLTRARGNGDVVRYDPGNNLFGVMDSTGAPKTYFRPDPASHGYPTNLDYFNAQ